MNEQLTVTGTRHRYGTAEVYVEGGEPITAPSRESRNPTTIVPTTYYVEDEDDYGFRSIITASGHLVKKDGTVGARRIRVIPGNSAVPDAVWEALRTMRPDLKPRMTDA
ncbi:hypothetical protein ACFVAJ_18465 [Agromyces sp. NPDC057679]|uniref:hypothetical protein n=1 Tax=Agromyces sp. NPDC057679 TaxID=3346207 RepID=UPI00366F2EBF